jgi:hypothetical protein
LVRPKHRDFLDTVKLATKSRSVRRGPKNNGAPARKSVRRESSFAAAAEKFRGMLITGPRDLSTREGFGR